MDFQFLPTTIVGSYAQPDWLIDRGNLSSRLPPRVRAKEIWRVPENFLHEAQNDATLIALHDQERAGIDILGDGEMRRESYSNRVANALDGIDLDNHGTAIDRTGKPNPVPRVVGPIKRARSIEVSDAAFTRHNTDKPIKITVPGPFTMSQQAQNDYYPDAEHLAMAYAEALNGEIRDLANAGVDIVQLDEPYMQARAEYAREFGVKAVNRAIEGVECQIALHICFGYAHVHGANAQKPSGYSFLSELADCNVDIVSVEAAQPRLDLSVLRSLAPKKVMLGVIDLGDLTIETPNKIADRIRAGLEVLAPEDLIIAPDCGMKYLSREIAFGKLKAMVDGARIVRDELNGAAN